MKAQIVIAAAFVCVSGGALLAQEMTPPSPDEHSQHQQGKVTAEPAYPRMGRAQEQATGPLLSLEQVEEIAARSNPTLRQAEAEIRAAIAHRQQAGLYPNPTVGYTGDEIRGGSVGGGKQGFFVQQTIVTGGKLALNRDVYTKETKLAELQAEVQKVRVTTAVKMAFLGVLGAQELLDARRDLANIAQDAAETQRRLMNTGQADETEVLEAEVEVQRLHLAARAEENTLRERWRSLAAVVGQPELPVATVGGDLAANWPELNEEETLEAIAKQSPVVRIADAMADREMALLARARRQPLPEVEVLGGLEYNNDLLVNGRSPKGWEGLAEVGVQLPIFNRNQGEIAAARAEIDRDEQERKRIALALQDRAASTMDRYASARQMALAYRDENPPRARKAYALMVEKYGQTLASYPRVLDTQKKLYELQSEYIMALEGVWTNGIALQGYLLTDGLEVPTRAGEVNPGGAETNQPAMRALPMGEILPRP